VVAGLAVHALWFGVCEKLAPSPVAVPAAPAASATPPAPPTIGPSAAPALRPQVFVRVPVFAVLEETPDIRTFRFARPEGFDYRPGQFVMIRVQVDGKPVVRCYSISSSPEVAGYLEVSVKRQGLVSGLLHATIRPGAMLEVKGPSGPFVYPEGDGLPLVLIAGGVGITPLRSMLRHAIVTEPSRPVTLLYSVKTESDIAYREELIALARRHPQLQLVVAVSGGSTSRSLYSGRIDARLLESVVPDRRNAIYMLCGPPAMIESLKKLLPQLGAEPARVRSEAFEAANSAAHAVASVPATEAHVAALPVRVPVAAGAAPESAAGRTASAGRGIHLTLTVCKKTVAVSAAQSLLEAAEAAGGRIESSCRAGSCGTCRTRLVSGEVEGEADGLSEGDRREGYIHPCVTYARGDCALEA
jgi:ferredoxin-NADP reductase